MRKLALVLLAVIVWQGLSGLAISAGLNPTI